MDGPAPNPEPRPDPGPGPDIVWSRFLCEPAGTAPAPDAPIAAAASDLALVADNLDIAWYRAAYPDIDQPGFDPVAHFHTHGWRERRNPSPWFDTAHYLDANPDVAAAGIDPLVHYLRHGHAEGRPPIPAGGQRRRLIDAAIPPAERPTGIDAPPGLPTFTAGALAARLHPACDGAAGLVLSVSHDRYIDVTGGIQLLIADEQGLFNANRFAYLHAAPAIARLTTDPGGPAPAMLQLVLNGRPIGLAADTDLAAALAALPASLAPVRLFTVHSLFGHRIESLIALAGAVGPGEKFFWVHDYATICEGYTLLRDDVAFCGAPPPDSMACRVCVYGAGRAAHRAAMRRLFGAVGFHVVAPSRVALELWRAAADLPHRSARVQENALLESAPQCGAPDPVAAAVAPAAPVTIAFAGYPMGHKGWPDFLALVRRLRGVAGYRLYHFASPAALRPMDGVTGVAVRADRHDRHAMSAALARHRIDLVLVLSPWPETFSYIAHEAFAAGSDVVTLAASGNVAAAVRRHGRGVILRDAAALLDFFADGRAAAYARASRAAGARPGVLHLLGGTATLDPAGKDGPDPLKLASDDSDLSVLVAGRQLRPMREGTRYSFDLPPAPGALRLVSRSIVPAALRSDATDQRRLGVAVRRLELDGQAVPAGDDRRGRGWHGPDDAWQWTSGDAVIDAGAARRLDIDVAPLLTYVVSPFAAATEPAGTGIAGAGAA